MAASQWKHRPKRRMLRCGSHSLTERFPGQTWRRHSPAAGSRSSCNPRASYAVRSNFRRGRRISLTESSARSSIAPSWTPWSAHEAVFGCSAPTESGADRITTVIAVTTRKVAMSYVQAVSGFHPAAVAICTDVAERNAGRVKVFEQRARGQLDAARLSRVLLIALAVAAVGALLAVAAAAFVADSLDSRENELAQQISLRRAAIRTGGDGRDRSPIAALERRKYETPSSAIMLDALSQVLPDHTYVTELHLSGSKLQIVGITRDAPSLIPLIEQSPHFTRATFYAPTTRSTSDPGERFHIEARVEPKNTSP